MTSKLNSDSTNVLIDLVQKYVIFQQIILHCSKYPRLSTYPEIFKYCFNNLCFQLSQNVSRTNEITRVVRNKWGKIDPIVFRKSACYKTPRGGFKKIVQQFSFCDEFPLTRSEPIEGQGRTPLKHFVDFFMQWWKAEITVEQQKKSRRK